MSADASYKTVVRELHAAKRIVIARHLNPDGDALGAQLGLGLALEAAGKEVHYLLTDAVPAHLAYLPALSRLQPLREDAYDLFVLVDLGDKPRMGSAIQAYEQSARSICIDHHRTNEGICDVNWVCPQASSTCELIAALLLRESMEIPKDAATALFAGIVTDSNRFLYETARARTMRIAADLLECGADASRVYFHEYQNIDAALFALQGYVVEHALYLHEGRVALANLTPSLLDYFGVPMAAAESVVDVLKNLSGVEVAVVVKDQEENCQKVSFRSKRFFDVSALAQRYGGGGHVQASGCTLEMNNEDALQEMKRVLENIPCSSLSMEF
uniref:DHH family phosphoesterase n=1 Tax=Ndongobacter massiliensis TaxID=1871025 RepID=UPI000930324E|nr:bifunctional oligoribonuclease/PAP phosphatase NrnA [Ndongobacter massiliensis]